MAQRRARREAVVARASIVGRPHSDGFHAQLQRSGILPGEGRGVVEPYLVCEVGDGGVLPVVEVLGLMTVAPALDDGRSAVYAKEQPEERRGTTHINRLIPRDCRCHIGSVMCLHIAEARVG